MRVKKAVFPVAGFGTRMLPATKAIPKEMVTLVDKPLIQYAVEEVVASGIEEIIFVTGRTKKALEDHFDISVELNELLKNSGKTELLEHVNEISNLIDVIYVRQKQMLGLGNAILQARDIVRGEPFAVILPDDILMYDKPVTKQLIEQYEEHKKPVVSLMTVPENDVSKYGIVDIKEQITDRLSVLKTMVEKPKQQDAPSNQAIIGRYILTPEVMEALSSIEPSIGGEVQLTDALRLVAYSSGVYGYEFEGKRFDCGTKAGLLEATLHFANADKELSQVLKATVEKLGV